MSLSNNIIDHECDLIARHLSGNAIAGTRSNRPEGGQPVKGSSHRNSKSSTIWPQIRRKCGHLTPMLENPPASTRPGTEAAPPADAAGTGLPESAEPKPRWWRIQLSATRSRIMAWVLLLILAALGIVTLVTWRLLIAAVDERMDAALRLEVEEFETLTASGVDPATGEPFADVENLIDVAISLNIARPNEHFLGYVDGVFYDQCRCGEAAVLHGQQTRAALVLANDASFTQRVGSVTEPVSGEFEQPELGEIRYLALPVRVAGDTTSRGVIVAAFEADAERAGANGAARIMLAVGAGTMLLATAAAWLLAGRILRPLHDVAETARSITDSDISRRIAAPAGRRGDELNDLIHTINGMLDRIEAGIATQRRFIDDAGHELRTPITIVRGHLELLNPNDPTDLRDTLALVDDELERMSRMVSDLLLLARSEQPSFVQPRPVDVAVLTRSIFDKVRQLGVRDFTLESVAEVTSVLDPQRITQAVVALTDNACQYTQEHDPIVLGSVVAGDSLRFWVTDSGPGVSDEDRSRIFERFSRGSAGTRRSDGAGLGLSIVAAIAAAHHGHVELDTVPGRGATFSVVIPVRGVE